MLNSSDLEARFDKTTMEENNFKPSDFDRVVLIYHLRLGHPEILFTANSWTTRLNLN